MYHMATVGVKGLSSSKRRRDKAVRTVVGLCIPLSMPRLRQDVVRQRSPGVAATPDMTGNDEVDAED